MAEILGWLANRLRPNRGWVALFMTLTALVCLPAALMQTADDWRPPAMVGGLQPVASTLLLLTVLALPAALLLARTRLSDRVLLLVGAALGLGLAFITLGRLLPPLSTIMSDLRHAFDWLRLWQRGLITGPLPFSGTAGYLWVRVNALAWYLSGDVAALLRGASLWSTTLYHLLATFGAWALAFYATWQIYRRRAPLAGLLPSGVLLTILVVAYRDVSFYLLIYLFCALWLEALGQLWRHTERWERTGTDYPPDMGMELFFAAAPWVLVLLLLAAFFPTRGFWKVSHAFWDEVEKVTGPLDSDYAGEAEPGSSLPQSHLLGGRPDLGQRIVFTVATNDPAPPFDDPANELGGVPASLEVLAADLPTRYWRGETLDVYTGQGWLSSSAEPRPLPPGERLDGARPPGDPPPGGQNAFELEQDFELVAPGSGLLYAANAPLHLDREAQAWWRGPGDLVRLSAPGTTACNIVSRPPEPTIAALRQAPETLPPDLAERYLDLPEGVPQRVTDLALEVTAGAGTRYDQARAIETFLRTYTYTLDLPPPPANRDVVDYFLFERQEGYCDYYASAMVVMARAAGIPARFATGYAQGRYDYRQGRWVVTEEQGHSWAEVYFDGIGWVEFEPTAGLPSLERPSGGAGPAVPAVPPLPPRSLAWWQQAPWGLLILAGVLLLAIAALAWLWRPRRPRVTTAAALVRDRQARLLRWGARLGQPLRDGQTAHEYGQSLGRALRARGKDSRWSPVRRAAGEVPPEVEHLTGTFERAQYSPTQPGDREGARIRDLWQRLRRRLWWLWLGGRGSPPDPEA